MDRTTRQNIRNLIVELAALVEWANDRYENPPPFRRRAEAALEQASSLRDLVQGSLEAGNAFYFGSVGGEEHRLFDAELKRVLGFPRVNVTDLPDIIVAGLDGGFLPDTQEEGRARVQVLEGWTVLALPDRSADRRAGSHSTFVFKGVFGGVLAVTQARLLFPAVFARYPFLVEVTT